MQDSEKKRVFLMGPPRVAACHRQANGRIREEPQRISQDAKAMQLLALLLLSRGFLTHEAAKTGGEVRRDWLLERMYPGPPVTEPQGGRDGLIYLLGKLDARLEISAFKGRREPVVFRMAVDHLGVDVLKIAEAAKHLHVPENQEAVIALADRPLLEGMAYPWLQEEHFQKIRAELDAYFLTALARRADSLLVQKEEASGAGWSAEADAFRARALPLLDKAAERLDGYAGLRCRPEHAVLLPFESQFSRLRGRASYPLTDGGAAALPAHNLPHAVTSFVGREQERRDIWDLLTSGRLVTLIGMGGCGKTRLAVQTAWDMLDDLENVRLVELAGLTAPDRVPHAVAAALGVTERPNVSAMQAVTAFLQQNQTLLLLDNCEHLRAGCAGFAADLLRSCPALRILATSREPLNVAGEHLCRVAPLPFPAPDFLPDDDPDPVAALLGYDAARLFLDRALQFRQFSLGPENVAPVAAICAALDGIPLALELAAARVQALRLEQIAEMLSDRFGLLTDGRHESPARHKTLRAVIDWSYDLLTEPEQLLLCRLSVFAGGWTLDAAAAVGAAENTPRAAVLGVLTGLVDKSLIAADLTAAPGRYRMLETVRQYAQDRLRERGEWEETRRRHRLHYSKVAEGAAPHLKGPEPTPWLDRLETESDNLRVALGWREDADVVWLACTLLRFWLMRGYLQEGIQWLERGARTEEAVPDDLRARALNGAGSLAFALGDFAESWRRHEEALALARQAGDEAEIAEALNCLGGVAAHQGDCEKARELTESGLTLRRRLGDQEGIAGSLNYRAMAANYLYEYEAAKALLQECLTIVRSLEDVRGIANCLHNLGIVACYQCDYVAAQALFGESLALWLPLGDKYSTAKSFSGLGEVALRLGDYEAAQSNYMESLELRRQSGDKYGTANSLNGLAEAALHRKDYPAARALYEESLALRRQIGDTQSIAHSLHNLGELALRQNDHALARELFTDALKLMKQSGDQYGGVHSLESLASASASSERAEAATCLLAAAEALRAAISSPRSPAMQEEYLEKVEALRASLGEAAFNAAWEKGQRMTWEEAVAFALEQFGT